jgi:hypothetical protein
MIMNHFILLISLLLLFCCLYANAQCTTLPSGYLYTNGTCLSGTLGNNYATFSPNLKPGYPISQSGGQRSAKQQPLPSGSWIAVKSSASTGVPGMIHRIWLALAGSATGNIAANTFIAIVFDGAATPQFGYMPTTPTYQTAIELDLFFSVGDGTVWDYRGDDFWVNQYTTTSIGAGFTMDMPFQSGWTLYLYNADSGSVAYQYWIQVEQSLYESTYPINPSYLYLRLNQNLAGAVVQYPTETPFLSVSSPNGVKLKWFKWLLVGGNNPWIEGTFRVYVGGSGLTGTINGTHYTDTTYSQLTPYTAGATIIFESTGVEDFFLSSYSFNTDPYYANRDSGYIWCSSCSTTSFSQAPANMAEASSFSAYRQWGGKPTMSLPSAPPNQYLVFTWQVGNVLKQPPLDAGQPTASANWFAFVTYYA